MLAGLCFYFIVKSNTDGFDPCRNYQTAAPFPLPFPQIVASAKIKRLGQRKSVNCPKPQKPVYFSLDFLLSAGDAHGCQGLRSQLRDNTSENKFSCQCKDKQE